MDHTDYKITCCSPFVDKNKPYIVPLQMECFYVNEIKCPFKFRDQFIKEGINDCDFLEILHGKIHLEKSHKYYTQVFKVFYMSQMAVTGTSLAYFIILKFLKFFT